MRFIDAVLYPFTQLRKDIQQIMTTADILNEKLDTLNAAITEETAQQKAVVDQLRAHANDKEDPALLALVEKLDASIARVRGIVPDVPAAEPPAEPVTT